jgi:DNA-directed RNA polymerase specialized sigma24 family protein
VSEFIDWTGTPEGERAQIPGDGERRSEMDCAEGGCDADQPSSWESLPTHEFAEKVTAEDELESWEEGNWDRDPDLWLYRKKTTTLLRRYMRWSLEAGRVPSLLGRELFRARISAYSATTFEERVIFLHDIEVCLDRLKGFDRQIVARIVLQEHDHEAAARILQCDRKTIERRLPELIDELTEVFLQAGLLERLPESKEEAL